MFQRIAVFVAALAAALVLAVGISTANVLPAAQPTAGTTAAAAIQATDQPTQVDTIYLPAPVAPPTITVHHNVPPTGGQENETEGTGG
jgi:hypothetical protein